MTLKNLRGLALTGHRNNGGKAMHAAKGNDKKQTKGRVYFYHTTRNRARLSGAPCGARERKIGVLGKEMKRE